MHSDTGSTAGVTAAAVERIEEARGRADAATPGPWVQFEIDDDWDGDPIVVSRGVKAEDGGLNHGSEYELFEPEDADFIAHARADVPLLAEIAAAAVRLVQAIDADELQDGWRDEIAICDDPTSACWRDVLTAIRAAGEPTP